MKTNVADTREVQAALAHISQGAEGLRQHPLADHLREVGRRASASAAAFGGQDWAHLAGLWHDLGKYRPGFQRYLRAASAADAESAHIEGGAAVSCSGMQVIRSIEVYSSATSSASTSAPLSACSTEATSKSCYRACSCR